MALVSKLEPLNMEKNSVHGTATCTYSTFAAPDGKKYLQIDTYGSPVRKIKGKKSQSIQFGPEGVAQLRKILAEII